MASLQLPKCKLGLLEAMNISQVRLVPPQSCSDRGTEKTKAIECDHLLARMEVAITSILLGVFASQMHFALQRLSKKKRCLPLACLTPKTSRRPLSELIRCHVALVCTLTSKDLKQSATVFPAYLWLCTPDAT